VHLRSQVISDFALASRLPKTLIILSLHVSDAEKFEVLVAHSVTPTRLAWIENVAYNVYCPSWDGCSHSAKQPSHGVAGSSADRV
jgi:hypothetical protein